MDDLESMLNQLYIKEASWKTIMYFDFNNMLALYKTPTCQPLP